VTHGAFDDDSPTLTSFLLRVLDRTSSDRTTTYRPHTPLVGPEPPVADPAAAAVPEHLETVDVEPAGTVPVSAHRTAEGDHRFRPGAPVRGREPGGPGGSAVVEHRHGRADAAGLAAGGGLIATGPAGRAPGARQHAACVTGASPFRQRLVVIPVNGREIRRGSPSGVRWGVPDY
jgi:hypothetical protein